MHFLHRVHLTHSNSGFDRAVQLLHLPTNNQPQKLLAPPFPLWALLIKQFVLGVNGANSHIPQAALLQATLTYLFEDYTHGTNIFTDDSTTQETSSRGLYVPSTSQMFSYRLHRETSSTTAGIHGVTEAVCSILRRTPVVQPVEETNIQPVSLDISY